MSPYTNILYLEFLTLMARKIKDTDADAEIREAFRVFDKNNDGHISKDELSSLLSSIDENMTAAEIDILFNSIDTGMCDYIS